MATFAVDAEGQRIKTDILVAGYIKMVTKEYKLLIPNDIIRICFVHWLIKVCDSWDTHYIADTIEIDGQIVKVKEKGFASVYGSHSICKGTYSWTLRFNTMINSMVIGIIEDNEEILKKVLNENCNESAFASYGRWIINKSDQFYDGYGAKGKNYHEFVYKKDSIIIVTLDMDNHSLSFAINGEDYGVATSKLDKDKYRFIINTWDPNEIVELL